MRVQRRLHSSLFFCVARSARRVSQLGVRRCTCAPARDSPPASPAAPGRNRLIIFIMYPVRFGKSAFPTMAPRAAIVRVSDGWPRRQAARIFLAARSAFMEINGAPAAVANHANSMSWSPLNFAFTCEPVPHHSGCNGGYMDVVACELSANRIRETSQRKFADAVWRQMWHGDLAANRGNINNASPTPHAHFRNDP